MLTGLNKLQEQAILDIALSIAPCDEQLFRELLKQMQLRLVEPKKLLFEMGDQGGTEYFVTQGILRTYVLSPEGEEVTMGFFVAPCALTPSIARDLDNVSQISCDALTPTTVASLDGQLLIQSMMQNQLMQLWGDTVMRSELTRKMRRELGLATHTAKQRLEEFRTVYPELEDQITHSMIASYLGMTPVTLSRLRNSS